MKRLSFYLMSVLVLIASVMFMGASCSASTANVSNAVTTTNIDENYLPVDNVSQFPLNSTVYVTAELHNAPDDTDITFIWYYEGEVFDGITIGNEGYSDVPIYSYLPAEMVTQTGNYSVEIYIDDRDEPDARATFTVVSSNNSVSNLVPSSNSTAQVTNAVMTTNIDENYLPVDHVTQFPVNSMVYVTAELHNAPANTLITFDWYYEGQLFDSVSINNEGYSDVPIYSYLPAEMVTLTGSYSVEIYIDNRANPDAVSTFTVV